MERVYLVIDAEAGLNGMGWPVAALPTREAADKYVEKHFPFFEAYNCRFAGIEVVPFFDSATANEVSIS